MRSDSTLCSRGTGDEIGGVEVADGGIGKQFRYLMCDCGGFMYPSNFWWKFSLVALYPRVNLAVDMASRFKYLYNGKTKPYALRSRRAT